MRDLLTGFYEKVRCRGGSRTAATSKMERFVVIVNSWKPLTIITKRSILDVAAVLDPPLRYRHMGRTETIDITFKRLGRVNYQQWLHIYKISN